MTSTQWVTGWSPGGSVVITEDVPVAAIPTNVYMLIYLLFALAIGPAGMAVIKAVRDWRAESHDGRKDHITEMEDWNADIIRERNFYHAQSMWRNELIGRLEYAINTNPNFGPHVVTEIRATMPPEPQWPEDRPPGRHKGRHDID